MLSLGASKRRRTPGSAATWAAKLRGWLKVGQRARERRVGAERELRDPVPRVELELGRFVGEWCEPREQLEPFAHGRRRHREVVGQVASAPQHVACSEHAEVVTATLDLEVLEQTHERREGNTRLALEARQLTQGSAARNYPHRAREQGTDQLSRDTGLKPRVFGGHGG
jgi:hypothetical protein